MALFPRATVIAVALCLLTLIQLVTSASAQGPDVFRPAADIAISRAQADQLRKVREKPTNQSTRLVRINETALDANAVSIPLLARSVNANKRKTLIRTKADFTWIADIQDGGQAILVVRDGNVTGFIETGREHYIITPLGDRLHALSKIDQSSFPSDHPRTPPRGTGSPTRIKSESTSLMNADVGPSYVDVLVAYTPAARNAYGGDMSALARLSVDAANVAYANSNANVVLRLAGTMQVDYAEPANYPQMLSDLSNGVGSFAQVHTARDQLGADLVSLLVANQQYCGFAWINSSAASGYSTVTWNCAVGNHSFVHELGHNFGARHDPYVDPSTNPYAYGHGYVYGKSWRTIMSYAEACGTCPRLQYFSNPGILYQNVPTGTAEVNDNARVHRERVQAVSGFRGSVGATYVLSLNDSPAAGGTVSGAGTYLANTSVTATAAAATGYKFSTWTENGTVVSTLPSYTFALSGDRTLTANFSQLLNTNTVSLRGSPGAGGAVRGAGTFPSGSAVTVNAVANPGYAFAGWMEGKRLVSPLPDYTFTLVSNRSLTASFQRTGKVASR